MKTLYSLLLFFSFSILSAQGFTGTITNAQTGEALPYASIYVKETGSGTVSNELGSYQLRLNSGSYTLVFQYLGYATQVKQVSSGGGYQSLDVALLPEALDLEEIEVIDGQEDASYSVIRRAIAKADYHRNQVDAYTAEVYVKGTGKVDKIPKAIMAMIPKEDRAEIDTTQAFVSESISKVTYERPNTFKQEVLSIYERGEFSGDATPYLFGSFYDPEIAEGISPLSTKAFGYYRFEHEGLFLDRDNFVNKIKVIPRSRGEGVFEGYIYIVEDDWSIHSLDLSTYQFGFRFNIRQNYAPIEPKVWMPVTTTVDVDGKILGIALRGHYVSTVSDYVITLNPDLPGYVEVIDEKTNPETAAEVKRENRTREYETILEEGGELTRREMMRLMREYEKQERKEAKEPKVESNYAFVQDSTTKTVRDTAFWAQRRPVPLTPLEARSYAIQDSLTALEAGVSYSVEEGDSVKIVVQNNNGSSTFGRFLKKFSILPEFDFFNAVEGYALGARIGRSLKAGKGKRLNIGVTPRYGFSWERMTFKGDMSFRTSKDRRVSEWRLEGGRFLRQYDDGPAMPAVVNTFAMLFTHRNYVSWYERAYGSVQWRKRWNPAFAFKGKLAYEDRRNVSNTTDAGWFNTKGEDYAPNLPFNAEAGGFAGENLRSALTVNLSANWKPWLRYEIRNGRKSPITNSSPTLSFLYAAGLPELGNSVADFHRVEAGISHRFEAGIRGKIDFLVRGGAFLSNNFVQLPDFKHFATSGDFFYTGADPIGSFRLLPFYEQSTSQEYLETYVHYQFRKFLFSRIWRLQRMGVREDLFVNYLYSPESDHYFEAGYTIDNIFRIVRLEFVTSWQDFKYRDFGIRMSVASIFGRQ